MSRTAIAVFISTLLVLVAVIGGVDNMITNLVVGLVVAVMTGDRVEGAAS